MAEKTRFPDLRMSHPGSYHENHKITCSFNTNAEIIMRRLWRKIADLSKDNSFLRFQNSLSFDLYKSLSKGYSVNSNEIGLVKDLVDVANGKSYGSLKLYANMLHGSKSYVEFNHRDIPVTRELGDMAIISLVTYDEERLLQKLCIIQNKKASGNSWDLDLEQLYSVHQN
jgi:hypothetical protein